MIVLTTLGTRVSVITTTSLFTQATPITVKKTENPLKTITFLHTLTDQ
jgi:hypothetical protein